MTRNNQSLFYKTMYNSGFRDKSLINKSLRKYSNLEKKDSQSIEDNNSIKNVEKFIKNKTINQKDKNINNKMNNIYYQNVIDTKISNDEKKTIKINGKLFKLKKNLGKYLLEQ